MADYSKDNIILLLERFGDFLTLKLSNLFHNLDSRSVGAIAGLAVAIVFTWRLLRSPSEPRTRQCKRQTPAPSNTGVANLTNPNQVSSGVSSLVSSAQNVVDEFFQPVKNLQICDDVHLDNQMLQHESGGSSTTKLSRYFDEVVPIGNTSMDFGKLKLVHDQPCYKSANDRRLSTQSEHMGIRLNLEEPEVPKTVIAATSIGMSERPFDICLKKTGVPKSLSHLLVQNRVKRNEKRFMGGQDAHILRPGMVLLKNSIPIRDQVKIVQICRKLGQGIGGFYQPSFGDGATAHSKMMCLGKNWDCQTKLYAERREVDGAEPPPIPSEFHQLVQKAIQDAHAYLLKEVKQKHVESVLPSMTPDICIVNFYTSNGRLGLHKDKSESTESLNRGIPIVSISIDDSAEFLYGDQRNVDKAEKIILESGDVLIFGGKSRHIYHGVSSIILRSAPQALLQESDLRPGRLNLTFRQY